MIRKTSADYVMGIPNIVRDNSAVHHDFQDQLKRRKHGWYETELMFLLHKKSMIKQAEGCKKFYLPHKAVIFENAESGKLKIVCDATARENSKRLLLNDCLETVPTF